MLYYDIHHHVIYTLAFQKPHIVQKELDEGNFIKCLL